MMRARIYTDEVSHRLEVTLISVSMSKAHGIRVIRG
jgi:hypothetical protein